MDQGTLRGLLRCYFGAAARASSVSSMEHGLENEHYRVDLVAPRQRSYFVKVYRTTCAERVSTEVALVTALRAQGLHTPAVIATRDGDLFTKHQGRLVALFEFVEGVHPEPIPTVLAQTGALLARLHACDLDLELPPYSRRPEELLGLARAVSSPDAPTRDFFHGAARLCSAIPWDDLPRAVTHCDVFLDNLIQDGDVLHLIDFEKAARDCCLLDICRAFIGCCIHGARLDADRCRALLRGYRRARPLEPSEVEQLYACTVYAGLLSTYWRHEQITIMGRDESRADIYRELMVPTLGLMEQGRDHFHRALGCC